MNEQPTLQQPSRRPAWWASALLLALGGSLALAGCDGGGTVETRVEAADATPPAVESLVDFTLRVEHDGAVFGRRGPLRVQLTHLDSGVNRVEVLAPRGLPGDADYTLRLPERGYQFKVFYDRDDDGGLDDCPFPPSPADTAAADTYDNVQGTVEAQVQAGGRATVQLGRRICGPGDPTTGIRGTVRAPAGVDLRSEPVHLLLEPVVDESPVSADAGVARAPMRLQVPLFPGGFETVGRFDIGELVPGRYRLTFFADADRDGRPSPCRDGVGGGDRFTVSLDTPIEVTAGSRFVMPSDAFLADDPACPDALTGVALEVGLPPTVQADPSLGALRFGLFSPNGGDPVVNVELSPTWVEPARFTLSGLPPGAWRLAVWFDRDRDGAFTPCGGLPAGLDTVFGIIEDVRIRAGEIAGVGGPVVLVDAACDDQEMALLSGRVWLPSAAGPEGSGRPVRLELIPGDGRGERRDVLLFDNHRADLGAPASFTRGLVVPAGAYTARLYLDSNRDGELSPCPTSPYGDRAVSPEFTVVFGGAAAIDVGERSLPLSECDVPPASIRPRVRVDPAVAPYLLDGLSLRLFIEEAGGWHADVALPRPDDVFGAGFDAPMIRLAPGDYRIVAYLDSVRDERFQDCSAEVSDQVVGRVDVSLTAETPDQAPLIVLEPACGR